MRELFLIPIAQAGAIMDAPNLSSILVNVLYFLLSVIGIVAILGLLVSGILYLTAYGSPERIESAKKSLMASVIGLVISLGALVIVNTIQSFFE